MSVSLDLQTVLLMHSIENCAFCGARIKVFEKRHSFQYKQRGKHITLQADIPMSSCGSCGQNYPAMGAQEAEREAIYAFHGRLTPVEIIRLRRAYGLTQQEFAKVIGVGRGAMARWETGEQMQSAQSDKILRNLGNEVTCPLRSRRM